MFRRSLIIALLVLAPIVAHAAYPAPTGFVNDFANVIDGGTKSQLESLLTSFERQTGDEIAVATLPTLDGMTVEDVAAQLYKTWGIGKKGKDKGALFVIAPNDRRMRIEVGYGLEGTLNDALTGRILDEYVVPRFKAAQISDGIAAGTVAIVKTIVDKEGISFDAGAALGGSADSYAKPRKKGGPLSVLFKVIFSIIAIYLFIRHPWLFLLFMSGGGRGGGGGFGGGFGGFGGGMSGGGGASRGW